MLILSSINLRHAAVNSKLDARDVFAQIRRKEDYGIAQFQAFLGSLYLKVVLALSAIALALYGVWWVQNAIREQRSWGSKHIKRH